MNTQKLNALIKNKSKEYNVTTQEVYDIYFFEEFLNRLSKSNYKNKYVLKGGFLLENILGVDKRSTLDLDLAYKSEYINVNELKKEFEEILNVKNNQYIFLKIFDIKEILVGSDKEGFSVRIEGTVFKNKKIFTIDVATGDYITLKPVNFIFKSIIDEDISFEIISYDKETILAEKIETIISKSIDNSRMKDYYDVYLLFKSGDLYFNSLKDSFINTFENRNTKYNKGYVEIILNDIKQSKRVNDLYIQFLERSKYTTKISFINIIEIIKTIFSKYIWNDLIYLNLNSIIIVRHGEDEQNKLGGWSDNKLTNKGINQIVQTSHELKEIINKDFIVISSDLNRAKQSALIIEEELKVSVVYDKQFRETNNGDFKNMNKDEFFEKHRNYTFADLHMDQSYPGGESPKEFYDRIKEAFIDLNNKYKNKDVLLITHNGVYGVIKSLLEGVKWSNKQKYQLKYGEYKVFKK